MCWKIFISIACILVVSSSEGRKKRIINGAIIRDRLYSYDAVKYSVWIGYGCNYFERFPKFSEEWDAQRLHCGGALLASNVIQTACHCFAEFEGPERGGFVRAMKKHISTVVVAGESEVERKVSPIPIHHSVLHPFCGLVDSWAVYDFAVVVTRHEFKESARITFAPVYPVADLAEMWSRFTTNLNVCLIMGFGPIRYNYKVASPVLRHGWQSIITHHECYDTFSHGGLHFNLTEYLNFVPASCLNPLSTRIVSTAKGDSGTPITCDGKYFAVHSQSADHCERRVPVKDLHRCVMVMDLVYYAYANAQEYRSSFVKEVTDYDSFAEDPPPFIPQSPAPYSAPPHFVASINKANGHARTNFFLVVHAAIFAIRHVLLLK